MFENRNMYLTMLQIICPDFLIQKMDLTALVSDLIVFIFVCTLIPSVILTEIIPSLFFQCIYFNWSIITLQYCDGFCHTSTWISHEQACVPPSWTPSQIPPHPIPLGCARSPALGALLLASNLHWSFILHVVIYMFQCYSLKSSPHF